MVSDSLNSSLKKLRHHSDASLLHALQTNISSNHANRMYVKQSLDVYDGGVSPHQRALFLRTVLLERNLSHRLAHTRQKEKDEGTHQPPDISAHVAVQPSQAGTCTLSRHGHVASAFPMALLHTHAPKKFWCHSTVSAMFSPYML